MKKLKILHVIDSLSPNKGGPSVSCPSLASAQANLGHKVSVVYYGDNSDELEIAKVGKETISYFEQLNRINLGPVDSIYETLFAPKMGAFLRRHGSNFNFVHIHGIWRPNLLVAANECARQNVRYAVAPRGMLDYWSMEQGSWKKKLFLKLFWKRALDKASFIHALNNDEKTAIERFNFSTRIEVSPNGVARSKLDEIDNVKAHDKDGSYILFMSRLHHKKGLDILAEAFALVRARFPDVTLKVAGPDEGALSSFRADIGRLNVAAAVELLGPVYGYEKYQLIKNADVFCLPSRQEGFSVMLAEVLACKRPVVISEQCNFPEVGQFSAGAVRPLEAVKIAAAIETYLTDLDKQKAHGENGRRLISEHFTWESIAAQLTHYYGH